MPLALLERLRVADADLPKALADLTGRTHLSEVILVSTCMRTEVYAVVERFHAGIGDLRNFLAELAGVSLEQVSEHLYDYFEETAASHLFEVASGLDSAVLGEGEVLSQVRHAWQRAWEEGAAGPTLSGLFRHAVEVGKRARSETAIARGITSLSQAAVALAERSLGGSLAGHPTLVVGVGDLGEGMCTALAARAGDGTAKPSAGTAGAGVGAPGASEEGGVGAPPGAAKPSAGGVLVANRTWSKAVELAARIGGRPVSLADLRPTMETVDVVLTSTGAPSVILEAADLEAVMAARGGRPLLVVDVAVPRNVDPAAGDLDGVTLLDMDDLAAFAEAGMQERRREATRVREIIAEEVERYLGVRAARGVAPVVVALRERAEALRQAELQRHRSRLDGLDQRQRDTVEALTRGLVAKLLHEPTVRLKVAATSPQGESLGEALRALFDL